MDKTDTAYDEVVYPSGLFPSTHPDRLAAIAAMHGLDAPPIETARVLDIGGGDGLNVIAMAMAFPDAHFLSFDLSATAAARGARIAAAAGLTNVTVGIGDICDAARDLNQEFDYIIAHGVYAWVPEPVREALLVLIGRVLSPTGIAFVSYNALPGGHFRRVIREMALHHVADIADHEERLHAAHAYIKAFSEPRAGDSPIVRGMRSVAKPITEKRIAVLYHDELGEIFEPQSMSSFAAAAADHGLAFLNDANPLMCGGGLSTEAPSERDRLRAIQQADYEQAVFFRSTLLVRAGREIGRSLDLDGLASLYMASTAVQVEGQDFKLDEDPFSVGDDGLAQALAPLAGIWPGRVRVGDVVEGAERLEAIAELFYREIITLHTTPLPGVRTAGAHPTASALARMQIAEGSEIVFTLDHRSMVMREPGPRAFLALLDGSRDHARLAADWDASGFGKEITIDAALEKLASAALLSR